VAVEVADFPLLAVRQLLLMQAMAALAWIDLPSFHR